MKKFGKILVIVLALATIVGCCFAFAGCNNGGGAVVKMIDVRLTDESYGFAINSDKGYLKDQINEIIDDIDIDEIANKFKVNDLQSLTDLAYTIPNTPSTDPAVRANQLVVATNAEFAPFEYKIGSKYAGIDIEIAKIIAQRLNKELVLINMDFDAVLFAVEGQTPVDNPNLDSEDYDTFAFADIGMAGLTILPDRDNVLWSKPYYQSSQVLITMANDTTFDDCKTRDELVNKLQSLQGKKAGAQVGTTGQFYMTGLGDAYEGFSNIEYVSFENIALAAQNMQSGGINFIVADYDPAVALVNSLNG